MQVVLVIIDKFFRFVYINNCGKILPFVVKGVRKLTEQERLAILKELLLSTYEKVYTNREVTVNEIIEQLKVQLEKLIM